MQGLPFTGHPNVEATIGEIKMKVFYNYGVRVQELSKKVASMYTGGVLGANYYEYSFINGTTTGSGIVVEGSENVGISFSQEMRRVADAIYLHHQLIT